MQYCNKQKSQRLYNSLNVIKAIIILPLLIISTLNAKLIRIDLSSNLSIVPATVEVSQEFNSTITITNKTAGSTTLDGTGATTKYHIPSNSTYSGTYNGVGWNCNSSVDTNGDISCQYNQTLNNGDTSNPLYITLTAPNSTGISNATVTVTATTTDADTSNDSSTATVDFGKSNLHATKTASSSQVGLNENFTYTITISNPSSGSNPVAKARNVTISDTLPSGVSFVSLNDTSWCNESSGTISCSAVDLDPDSSRSVTITAKVTTAGTKTNTATINADSSDYNALPLNPSATVTMQSANIALTKTLLGGIDANNAEVDSTVRYNISVTNIGHTAANDVNFTDTLPSGVTYVGISSGDWSCSGTSTITCSLSSPLTYNQTKDVNITVKMPSTHGQVNNTATAVTSSDEGGQTSNNSDTLTTYTRGVNLKITKSGNNATANVGSNFTYTITVTNNGLAKAKNIVVTDNLDPKMTYVSDTGGCSRSGQTLTCTHGTLNSSGSYSFNVTVKMPTDTLNDVINHASVTNDLEEEDTSDNSTQSTTHLLGPDLDITKDANVSAVGLGKSFTYTLHITSNRDINATDVNITDTLPTGVKITGINSGSFSCPTSFPITGTFSCTKSTFQGNATDTIVLTAKAPLNTTGNITNHVTISQSLNPHDGSDSKTITVTGVTLNVNKTGDSSANVGDTLNYQISIDNTSPSDAQTVELKDDITHLGAGYTINSITDNGGWDCTSSTSTLLDCKTSTLAAGASTTIKFGVNVPLNATLGNITNTANVTTTSSPNTYSDTFITNIKGSSLDVLNPTPTSVTANENVIFTVQVKNNGSATAKDVNLTNSFNITSISGADFTNIKIDCNNDGTYDITSSPYICSLGDIPQNVTKTIKISATAPNYDYHSAGQIKNNSTATTSSSDNGYKNRNWFVKVNGSDLKVTKTITSNNPTTVSSGVTFRINVTNDNDANATDSYVDDNLLSGFTNITTSGCLNDSANTTNNVHCTLGTIPAHASKSFTISAVAPNTIGDFANSATAHTSTAESSNSNNTGSTTLHVRGADLSITKSVNPTIAKLQESVTYTIKVTNNGLADANNTEVNDTMPAGFTNVSVSSGCLSGSTVSNTSINCKVGNIAQGVTKTITVTATAPNQSGIYTNNVNTATDAPESTLSNNSASATLTVKGADIKPYKSAPNKVAGNSTFTYTISLQNSGTSPAYGAEINDTIPTNNGTTYITGSLTTIDSDWTCTISGQNLHCYTNDSNLSIPNGYNHTIATFQVKAGPAHYWIYNTVKASTNTSESNTVNNTYKATTEVIDADLAVKKEAPDYIGINKTINYTLKVKNNSAANIDITDVNVTDKLPANVSNISYTADPRFNCNLSNGILFCVMKNGSSNPLKRSEGWITVATISATSIDAAHFDVNNNNNNYITNQYKAQTSLSDQNLGNNAPGGNGFLEKKTLVRGSNVSITKSVSNNPVGVDANFHYTLRIKNWPRDNVSSYNIPNTEATNIVVQDKLPADVNFTSATGTNWSCSESSHIVTCNYNGTLSPGVIPAPDITINVKAPSVANKTFTNEANVTNDTPELVSLLIDNNDSVQTTTQGADLSINKTGPSTAGMGETITYNIYVNNISTNNAIAKNIYVVDTLPSGVTFNGNVSNSHWTYSLEANNKVRFTYDNSIASGSNSSFSFDAIMPHNKGNITNKAEVFTSSYDTFTANNMDTLITNIKGADLKFNPITQNLVQVGAYKHHEYHVVIRNQGFADAHDINVTINYNDAGATPGWSDVNGSGTNWSCGSYDNVNNKLICHLSALAKNTDSPTLTISSTAPNYNGNIINTFTVVGKDEDNATIGDIKSATTRILGSDIRIIKYAKDPNVGGSYQDNNITIGTLKQIDFKLFIRNQNKGLAKDINITDTLPNGFTNINITNPGDWNCSVSSNTITCSRNSLNSFTSAPDILYSATTPFTEKTVTNTAYINTSTQEVYSGNNQDDVGIKISNAHISVSFTASQTEVAMGDTFSYILHLSNSGGSGINNLNATDLLNSDLTYIDNNNSDSGWTCSNVGSQINCNQSSYILPIVGTSNLQLNIKAPTNKIGVYANGIDVNSTNITPIHSNAPNVRVVGADLKVSIASDKATVLSDGNVTYTIKVEDINISAAHNINITQTFSHTVSALYITDSNGATCNVTNSNQNVVCTLNSLDYTDYKNIKVTATMPHTTSDIDPLTSNVTVTTSTPQEDMVDHNASVDVKVVSLRPVADYRFEECKWDDGVTGEVKDSINDLNATAYNGAKTVDYLLAKDTNGFSSKWRVGYFDGSDDYVYIRRYPKLRISKDQTICAWVKPTAFGGIKRNIFDKKYWAEGAIVLETDGKLSYYYGPGNAGSSSYQGVGSNQSIPLNQWSHICIVRDLHNMKLKWYINSVKTNETVANYPKVIDNNHYAYIGKGYTHNFKGYIDEVEIYDMALSDNTIQNIYNNERSGKNYDGTNRAQTTCQVNLKVTKTATPFPKVAAGGTVTYNITVKNTEAGTLITGFTLRDILPNNLTLNNITMGSDISCAGMQDINCTFPSGRAMSQNETRTIAITATTPNVANVNITNSASVHTGVAGITGQQETNYNDNNDSVTITTEGVDLGVTKTAAFDANGSNLIHYTMTVTNHSNAVTATGVSIIDTYDSRLSLINPPTGLSCNISNPHYFTCTLPNINPGSSIIFTSTMIAQDGNNIINDINVSGYTVDSNLSNNHAQVSIDVNTTGSTAPVRLKDGFRKHISVNNYGNMVAIGNTILQALDQNGTKDLTEVNTTILSSSSGNLSIPQGNVTIEYAGLYWGGHIKGKDKNDTLTGTFNTVKLTTPLGHTYTITGGDQENGDILTDDNATGFYRFKRDNNSIGRLYYSAEANVTSILRNEYATAGGMSGLNGTYTVSDINVSYGLDSTGSFIPDDTTPSHWSFFTSGFFGGWELVVIYTVNHKQYRYVRYKNNTIFDGYKVLMPRSPGQSVSLDINASGFITPSEGDIESTLFSMVYAGDMTLPYESMSIKDKYGISHFIKEGASNTNNIFNDTISLQDASTGSLQKTPDLSYNPGIDLDEFDLTSQYDNSGNCTNAPCYLSNSQNSTVIKLDVKESNTPIVGTSEYPAQYAFVNMLGFNTQIFTPDFIDSYKECFKRKEPGSSTNHDWVPCSDPLPPIHRGSILKYRITVINSGTDDAINVHVTDPLPEEVDFNGSCSSPNSDIITTDIYKFPDGVNGVSGDLDNDYNSTLRAISGDCYSALYDYNSSVRDECIADIKAILIDGNTTIPLGTIPDGSGESMNLINTSYNGTTCSFNGNRTTLTFDYNTFPKNSVTWIEFKTMINTKAKLGQDFENAVSIDFTNQTLSNAGINNLQTQQSEPVSSGTVTFNWSNIQATFKDPGRATVGTKIVNKPFNLNLSLSGINSLDIDSDGNTSLKISNLKIVDVYNGSTLTDITGTLVSQEANVTATTLNWNTLNTIYNKASKKLGFEFDLTVSYDSYTDTKHYPSSTFPGWNPTTPYTGDLFSTRPKSYDLSIVGGNTVGAYTIIKAAQGYTLNVNAKDNLGANAQAYNATLTKPTDIKIALDTNFSTNPACMDLSKLNINNLNFTNGSANSANTSYDEVGVIKIKLTDDTWTGIDQGQGDCIAGSGTNTAAGGIIGCNVKGKSTSIVFVPDHFDFVNPAVSDFGNGFTYMITNPLTDQVYGKLTSNVTSKNVNNATTRFFSSACFADDIQVNLKYNADSAKLNDLNLSIANEANLTNITSNAAIVANGNVANSKEQKNLFANGVAPLNLRVYMDKNKTTPLEPAVIDFQDINGSLNNYLGIAGANVNTPSINIAATNDIHFIYGRVHAPNYSSDTNTINAKIYYEGYCKDCNKSKFASLGGEDPNSVYWYINIGQNALSDGNITEFVHSGTLNITPGNSVAINNGEETQTITYGGLTYPYSEKVDINSSSWLIYNPFDPNANVSSFFVEFSKSKDWAGIGQTGKTIDINISSKGSKRIDW